MRKIYLATVRLIAFLLALSFGHSNLNAQTTVTITSNQNWTVPSNVYSVKVEAWGGGGGGGAAFFGYAGGGGGGAYKTQTISVAPGQIFSVNIGSGGGTDEDGGQTIFSGNSFNIIAAGGLKGSLDIFTILGNGGAGAVGDRNGGNGGSGDSHGAGGGGGAGNNGNGGNGGDNSAGSGGAGTPNYAPYVGGKGANSKSYGFFSGGDGNNGSIPGGGGGGAAFIGLGGSGGRGQVVLTYTIGPSVPTVIDFDPDVVCGTGGQTITVSGSNFTNPSTVIFPNNISVSATFVNSTTIKVTVPNGVVTGAIKVKNGVGTSAPSSKILIVQNFAPISLSGAGTYCGSAVLSASGGGGGTIYYQGTDSAGTSVSQGSSVTETLSGTHTFYFRELNSCGWGTAYPVTVTINPLPSAFTVDIDPECNSAKLTPGNLQAYLQTSPLGTDESRQGVQTVMSEGTYYYRAKSAAGCWGDAIPVDVEFKVTAEIIDQPESKEACVGTSVSFTINATSGSGITYKWMKGVTPLSDGGRISGSNSKTLTISNVQSSDAASDINVQITDACNTQVSDFVSLTVNTAATAPTSAPVGLNFNPVGVTSAVGQFTSSPSATYYIVIRSTTSSPVPNPTNGTTYAEGSSIFGANTNIDYIGTDNYFVSSGLNPGTKYYYWVYGFNLNPCGTSPLYNHTPASGNITTNTATNCGTINTFYWTGTGSVYEDAQKQNCVWFFCSDDFNSDFNNWKNWSTSTSTYKNASKAVPDRCDNAIIEVNANVTIHMSQNREINGLTFILRNSNNYRIAKLYTRNRTLTVNGNANIDLTSGTGTGIVIGEDGANNGKIIFNSNVILGNTPGRNADFAGTANSSMEFKGSVTLGPSAEMLSAPGTVIFNGLGQDLIFNTTKEARFKNVNIINSAQVTIKGSQTSSNIDGNLSILNNGQLFLPAGKQWNRQSQGGTFTMDNTARLFVSGFGSGSNGGLPSASLPQGSNFPGGFGTYDFKGGSYVYYNGAPGNIQRIYDAPTYNHLILRFSGTGALVERENTGLIKTKGIAQVEDKVKWTLGANIQHGSTFNLMPGGTVMAGNNTVSGTGNFNMQAGSTLGIGSANGIAQSGASGNIQSGGSRTFSGDATYIYNGTDDQITGSGLKNTVTNLVIDNQKLNGRVSLPAGPGNYEATGNLTLTKGTFAINGNTLTINGISRSSGKLAGSHTSNVTINHTSVPLFFSSDQSGDNYLKKLEINNGKSAYISSALFDTLNITAGLAAGQAGYLKLGSGSALTTNGNLTLKSNNFGTASIAEIPQDANGNPLGTITGDVTVERYINTGTSAGQHGKAWLFLSTPTTGQTIKQSWMENQAPGVVGQPGYGIQLTGAAGQGWDRTSPSPSIKEFDLTDPSGFKGASGSGRLLYNPKGWMVYVRGDRTVNGQSVTTPTPTVLRSKGKVFTGKQTFVVKTPTESFTSVGNPYPSAIDMTKVLGDQSTFFIWNASETGTYGNGKYEGYSYVDGHFEKIGGQPGEINDLIMSGQAFFIQSDNSTPNMVLNEFAKDNSSGNLTYFRGQSGGTPSKSSILRSLIYSNSDLLDGTMHIFKNDYSNNIDEGDARKMFNTGINLSILKNKKSLSVERKQPITEADTIFYNMTGATNGSYKFKFIAKNLAAPGLEAWLEDALTGTRTPVNLEGTTDVSFDVTGVAASKASNRFRMVFKPEAKGPLPVTFVHVNAAKEGLDVNVKWTVANEINLAKYVVMKSTDGNNFTDIVTVTANGGSEYNSLDKNAVNGYNYYRIRSEDKDGTKAYSQIVKLWIGNAAPSITVFPNPIVNGVVNLKLENQPAGKYHVRMLNPVGQVVLTKQFDHAGGNYSERIPWDYKMAHGTYQLEVTQPDGGIKIIRIMY